MFLTDRATTSTRQKLKNGFLRLDAVLARSGIQLYSAGELGLKDRNPTDTIRVWRPEAEVFKADSMATFASVPVTDDHPEDDVTPENAEALTKGWTGDTVTRDGHKVVSKITLTSKDLIKKVEDGKVELSNGYDCDLVWESGIVPAEEHDGGQFYDAKMVNIIGNHVAFVDAGRCGADCRVQDKAPGPVVTQLSASDCECHGGGPMADKALTKKLIDGVGLVEVTDEAGVVIDKLIADKASLQTKHDALDGKLTAADAAHADALAAKDKEIADLKAQLADTGDLDARVASRTALVTDAKRLDADVVTDGKTDAEIRRAVVTKKLGDAKVKDKSDAFVEASFETLALSASDASSDDPALAGGGGTALGDALKTPVQANDGAQTYEQRMADRYKKVG